MKIECKKCGNCCKGGMGPFVFPSDVLKISLLLHIQTNVFLKEKCEKHFIEINENKIIIYCLNNTKNGCIFLNSNNLCSIYENRPYQCVYAPYKFLSSSGLWNHMKCLQTDLLEKSNSDENDWNILKELFEIGYDNLL